jgi:FkbM family methyltransferase
LSHPIIASTGDLTWGAWAADQKTLAMFSDTISKLVRNVDDVVKISGKTGMHYSLAERISLLRARLSTGGEAKVLSYRVKYPNRGAFQIALCEIFFKAEYRFVANSDAPVILDCGANIGLATLFFKHLYPKAKITAFEADPQTASILTANVANNHLGDVKVHDLLLANSQGEQVFYVANSTSGGLMGSANSDRVFDHHEVMVKAGRLSQFISSPVDLLKLDVEGSEFDVLEDLVSSRKIALIRSMVIEYHHKIRNAPSKLASFLRILEAEGYEYQISAVGCNPIVGNGECQDIIIGAFRSSGDKRKTTSGM